MNPQSDGASAWWASATCMVGDNDGTLCADVWEFTFQELEVSKMLVLGVTL
jgi:hypothetical protein